MFYDIKIFKILLLFLPIFSHTFFAKKKDPYPSINILGWTKYPVVFIFYKISSGWKFWSVNHKSLYENSVSKDFKNITFFGEISNNWPNDLLGTNAYKTLDFCW